MGSSHSSVHHTYEDLAGALQERRPEVFTRLYEGLHARVYNLAARVVGDADEAADVTQDVFLKAFKDMPALAREVDVERWMYRVTVNTCYDLLRRRRTQATPLDDVHALPAHGDPLERAQLTHAVEAALADLNPRYRTALVLKDLHGLDNSEVADVMGISHGTAGVLLFRARSAFRRAFTKASPAGTGPAAGLGLAALLPALPVPAALQTPPAFIVPVVAPPALPDAGPISAAVSWDAVTQAASAPVVTGAMPKIGAALATKVAVVAIGASVVVGGGIAVRAIDKDTARRTAAAPSPAVAAPAGAASGMAGPGSTFGNGVGTARYRMQIAEGVQRPGSRQGGPGVGGGSGAGGQTGSPADGTRGSGGQQSTTGASSGQQFGKTGDSGTGGTGSGGTGTGGTGGTDAGGTGTGGTGGTGSGGTGTGGTGAGGTTDGGADATTDAASAGSGNGQYP